MNTHYVFTILGSYFFPFLYILIHRKMLKTKGLSLVNTSVFVSAIPFVILDIIANDHGWWKFSSEFIIGLRIANLPVEEYLFFLLIPQSLLLVWVFINNTHNIKEAKETLFHHKPRCLHTY